VKSDDFIPVAICCLQGERLFRDRLQGIDIVKKTFHLIHLGATSRHRDIEIKSGRSNRSPSIVHPLRAELAHRKRLM
jgi:hypothetical protein